MATVGTTQLPAPAFRFFDALRSYDAETACAQLADHCTWTQGEVTMQGDSLRSHLDGWLSNPQERPSFTTRNISSTGPTCSFSLSVSGRSGKAPKMATLSFIVVGGKIQQIHWDE